MFRLFYAISRSPPQQRDASEESPVPRRLRLEINFDQSEGELFKCLATRYVTKKEHPTKTSTSETPHEALIPERNLCTPEIATQIFGFIFSGVLQRIFKTEVDGIGTSLDLYEIEYRLPGMFCEPDANTHLISTDTWITEIDYWEGAGREYELVVREFGSADWRGDIPIKGFIARRYHGEIILSSERVTMY